MQNDLGRLRSPRSAARGGPACGCGRRDEAGPFRTIADATYDWESWLGPDGRPRWINPAVERITGYSVSECLAMADYPLPMIHPEDRPRIAELLDGARSGSSGNDVEFRVRCREERTAWVAISWRPVEDAGGRPIGIRTSIRDIAERKRLEEALRLERDTLECRLAERARALEDASAALNRERALLRTFLDHMPAAVSLKGLDGRYQVANPRFAEWHGLGPDEILGRTPEELFPPASARQIREQDRLVLEADHALEFEDEAWCSGAPTTTATLRFPLRDASGSTYALGVIACDVTDRKRAERNQAEWRDRYDAAVEAAGLVVYEWDPGADTATYGCSCEAILGYSPEELAGGLDRWVALIHPDDRSAFLAEVERFEAEHESLYLEYRLIRKDGRTIVVRDEGRYFGGSPGHPRRYIGCIADISEQARAEQALRIGERRFRAVFDQAFQLSGILATDGTILEANETSLEVAGVTREEVLGRPFWEIRCWSDLPGTRDRLKAAVAEATAGTAVRSEEEFRGRDDAVSIIDFSIKPVRDESGAVTLLIAEGRDITDRKRADRELAGALGELRAVMDAVPDILYLLDLDGRLVRWNRQVEEFTGLGPEELRGRPSLDFFPPEDQEAVAEAIRKVFVEGYSQLEARLLRHDSAAVPHHFRSVPLRDAAGQMVGLTGVGRDTSERLALEGALREQVETVEAINRVGRMLSSELDLEALVQAITDAAVELSGARFGALYSDVTGGGPDDSSLHTYSGPGRPPHDRFPTPAFVELLRPAFRGEGVVRLDDTTLDPRFRRDGPRPEEAPGLLLPVSCMTVPLVARSGAVLGALLLGHDRPGAFTDRAEQRVAGLAAQAAIALENARLVAGLERSRIQLEAAYDATIEGWSRALDFRDHETEGHSRRVTALTERLARRMGMPEAELVHIRRGALLHDIGKMAIPDPILNKPGPLDDEEREVMQRHPAYAREMLSPIRFLGPALDIPYCHHERWDGAGYPQGLRGEQIPPAARIFAAVDIYDALRSDRPYRRAWPEAKVREHLEGLAGSHLEPRVVEALLRLLADDDISGDDRPADPRDHEPACSPEGRTTGGPAPSPFENRAHPEASAAPTTWPAFSPRAVVASERASGRRSASLGAMAATEARADGGPRRHI